MPAASCPLYIVLILSLVTNAFVYAGILLAHTIRLGFVFNLSARPVSTVTMLDSARFGDIELIV